MKLVVQMPALNEAATVGDVVRAVPRRIEGIDEVAVLVVDDGSTDETVSRARDAGATVVSHGRRRGVGVAFRTGIEFAALLDADIIVTIDSDGQFAPADIPALVRPILAGQAEFVTASRFMDDALVPEMPAAKKWGNRFMARWISSLIGQRFYDVSCGFRAYARDAFQRLVLLGDFTYTHETFLNLAFAGVRMMEVPVKVRGTREHGVSRIASSLLHYGWRTSIIILRTYRDYRPMRFFGYAAGAFMAVAIGLLVFLLSVWLRTGGFTPHKWAGFVAAGFGLASLLLGFAGMVAEMLDRIRVAQQEVLYRVRRLEQQHRTSSRGES